MVDPSAIVTVPSSPPVHQTTYAGKLSSDAGQGEEKGLLVDQAMRWQMQACTVVLVVTRLLARSLDAELPVNVPPPPPPLHSHPPPPRPP